jgi:hypothetical protein
VGADDHGAVRVPARRLGDHVHARAELFEDLGLDPGDRARIGQVDADIEGGPHAGDMDALGAERQVVGDSRAAGLALVEQDDPRSPRLLGVRRLRHVRARPALNQRDVPGDEPGEVLCLAGAGRCVRFRTGRQHEIDRLDRTDRLTVAGERHEVPVERGSRSGDERLRFRFELFQLRRGALAEGLDVGELVEADHVPRIRGLLDDVVHRRLVPRGPGRPVPSVLVRDLLESQLVLADSFDGHRLP